VHRQARHPLRVAVSVRHALAGAAYGIRTVQALPGPWEVVTKQIHTHVLGGGTGRLPSPLDRLPGAVKPI